MFDRIYTQNYINLPKETREKITSVFGIVRTGITEIRDQTLISDATTNDDLKAVTIEKMEEYTGKTGTFAELWHLTLDKIEEREVTEKILPEVTEEPDEESIKTKKSK